MINAFILSCLIMLPLTFFNLIDLFAMHQYLYVSPFSQTHTRAHLAYCPLCAHLHCVQDIMNEHSISLESIKSTAICDRMQLHN